MRNTLIALLFLIALGSCETKNESETQNDKIQRVLIIDGQSNHIIWPKTSLMMRDYLLQTGLFTVDIKHISPLWPGIQYGEEKEKYELRYFIETYLDHSELKISEQPEKDPSFDPKFMEYDLIVLNLGKLTAPWPDQTRENFENYMKSGGGLVLIHATNNAWPDWDEFNKMSGIGGWDRDSISGRYVYYDQNDQLVYDDTPGTCGSHGNQSEYRITLRNTEHPITKGLPRQWMHTKDELYSRLRGPAENMTILATAFSDREKEYAPWDSTYGTNRHEPLLMVLNYGKGRVFHTLLGHFDYSMECTGFITTFQRGAEWAATGKVTLEIAADFPDSINTRSRKRKWIE